MMKRGFPKVMIAVFAVIIAVLVGEGVFVLVKGTAKGSAHPEVSRLHVDGTLLLNEQGDTVVLKGISLGWHNIWPRFYNVEAVRNLHDEWGAKLFRAAIGSDNHARTDNPGIPGGYIDEPELALQCVYNVIDAAIETGSYVIADWHSHTLHPEAAKEFFTQIATKYKGTPNIIYELFNEPVCFSYEQGRGFDDLGSEESMAAYWDALKSYAEELIEVITSIDDCHPLILMGTPSWDQRVDLVIDNPITGYDNVMYTMHFYAASHGADLRETTGRAIEAGIPVFISECAGMENTGDGPIDMESWNTYDRWAQEHYVSRVAWSVSDKDETCSMLTKAASSEGPWDGSVLKEWGTIVKNWLGDK